MYVWFDALTNYLSGVGYPEGDLAHFWPASVHVVGKDITWFHGVIWPCMLMSVGIPLPRTIFAHGFINDEQGRKMSKSIGNVIDPLDVLAVCSADTFRYVFHTHPHE
jgi:methionyl-tRNA synthetase